MESVEQNYTMSYSDVSRQHTRRLIKSMIQDLFVVFIAYAIAFWGNYSSRSPEEQRSGLIFTAFAAVLMVLMLYLFGVYQRIWERTSGHGATVIVNAVGAATVILVLADLAIMPRPLSVRVVVIGNLFALGGFVAVRFRSRLISGASWRWRAIWHSEFPGVYTRVLIVGAGESGQALAWRLKHRSAESRYKMVGFVDDDPMKHKMYVEGSPVLGSRQDIPTLAEKHNVDLIIVAIHNISGPDFREILSQCENTNVRIKVVPDVFAMMSANRNVSFLRDVQPEDLIGRTTVTRHRSVDMSPVTNKVVLVTGSAGSIGSELSRQLPEYDPVKLILLDNNESGLHDLFIELSTKYPNTELIPALVDITNRDALRAIYETYRPQVVFHAAAYKHVPMMEKYPNQAIHVNVGGTLNLAQLARDHQVERFVMVSTDKAVNPSSVMGASKRVCELIVMAFAHDENSKSLFTAVRFGNVLGSRGSVVPTFNRQIDTGGPVTITHPEMTRYFMSIPEAANLVIHAACLTKGADIFLLKMGEVVRIVDLAERMIRLRGLRPYKDIPIHFSGIRPGEKLHEELYTDADDVLETEHPGIIQLARPHEHLESRLLLESVHQLLQTKLTPDNAIDVLRQVIDTSQYILPNPDQAEIIQ